MTSSLLFAFCILILWVSHRIHDVYVQVVGKEEFRLRRLGSPIDAAGTGQHLGPKFFLLIDLAAVVAIIWSLKRLGFYFARDAVDTLTAVLLTCVHFGIVIALWMLLEALHLRTYYQRLLRAAQSLSTDAEVASRSRTRPGNVGRRIIFVVLTWTCIPIVLELVGYGVLSGIDTTRAALTAFSLGFLVPQVLLLAVIARTLLPLRRQAYATTRL